MLDAYGFQRGCLAAADRIDGPVSLDGVAWIDLLSPTAEEEAKVETAFKIDIPTREELAEIEASSRLYQEDGAIFMTATLIRRGEDGKPETQPVTFILKDDRLITVRYSEPRAFPIFIKRAQKPGACQPSGSGVLINLLETIVDRAADHLENVSVVVDQASHAVFHAQAAKRGRSRVIQEHLRSIGEEGDFNSKLRESLVSIGRLVAFFVAVIEGAPKGKTAPDVRSHLKTVQRDIQSLTDHSTFLSGKIGFLLDAILGMLSIEQNAIIKIFSVAAVVFLPPTLIASIYGMNFRFLPEFDWAYGYPMALGLMVVSAVLPFAYFKWKGWL
jgi:magnesium transporter